MIIIAIGFMLASYSVVANDSIQTLGTFLHSNSKRKWWILWLYSSSIMVAVMFYGWANYHGDVSYDRLDKVYAKMVDFKSAKKAIEASRQIQDFENRQVVLSSVDQIDKGLADAQKVYLADSTQLESQIATWSGHLNQIRQISQSETVPDSVRPTLQSLVSKTDDAIQSMLKHRNVAGFIKWYYILPPIVLLILTQFGFPVSTSFLILITFQPAVLGPMLIKSVSGYFLAFGISIVVYLTIMRVLEKHWRERPDQVNSNWWIVAQWASTAFLWSMWLIQDMANIFVYVPRPLPLTGMILCTSWMVIVQAFIYYSKGGKIQQIVTTKTNTQDIRSATIVDLIYGLILYFFKIQSNVPMSTTWVFIGLLAGRELAFSLSYRKDALTLLSASKLMGKDLFKVMIGLLASVGLAYAARFFQLV